MIYAHILVIMHVKVTVKRPYSILFLFGYLRDTMKRWGLEKTPINTEPFRKGYAPLYQDFRSFYTRHVYTRFRDVFNRPICSAPSTTISLKHRVSDDNNITFRYTGKVIKALNMGSFNYLGFADNKGPCADASEEATRKFGCAVASTRHEIGNMRIHHELESTVAEFLGTEAACVFGMGFASNVLNMPCLVGKGSLIISDEQNHTSLILGSILTGSTVQVFKHNDMIDLERKVRDAVINGQPKTGRQWKKILIVVEGVYSVEGSICKLHDIIRIKKKYKAYIYLDEAHSVGALGTNGRGALDYWGCDPNDVDILMGTFTKSFGSAGGYIAGSKTVIDRLKSRSHSMCYGTSMPAPVAQQIITSMNIIMGKDGTDLGMRRAGQLAWNVRYIRRRLMEMGFIIYGNMDSPVVPLIIFSIAKLAAFSRQCLKRGLVTVVVGYPATPLIECRARFCMSANHTKESIDKALSIIDEVGDLLQLKYSRMKIKPEVTDLDEDFRKRSDP
ncbi:hypothetical protein CAPTEDRAFT_203947 [Capitella teleta]|uniref:serine C-palmitoyltransferase n=1 Tax=Capitella teleta TaxID=283909 RepID=R7TEX8_CAPTE|nr:hypothetical protein CAPTEDRAFT_203947 [Capitella teleta]|eukprot:ELT92284.1 hypothetical protein CAPTEDRAFT_203947 [Capitella teleta]